MVAAGLPKEKPPPAGVLFAGVPKLKDPVGLEVACVAVPKVKPPPEAAGVEPVIPKPVPETAAVVFCAPKAKPVEACPKLNPPLILNITLPKTTNVQNGHFLAAPRRCFWRVTNTS